jgi:hypothetical protein
MKSNAWQQLLSAVTIAGLTAPFMVPAAQAQLIGQTRCAKQSTAIFSQRSAASTLVRAIPANQAVTLAENAAQNGFIAVSAPASGFIQTVTLKLCANDGTPPASTCRRVTATQGLLVRQGPNVSTAIVGGVGFNSQVNLTTVPATSSTDSTGRIWVQIARPLSGWISNGLQNTPGSNLVYCQ